MVRRLRKPGEHRGQGGFIRAGGNSRDGGGAIRQKFLQVAAAGLEYCSRNSEMLDQGKALAPAEVGQRQQGKPGKQRGGRVLAGLGGRVVGRGGSQGVATVSSGCNGRVALMTSA